MILIFGLSMGDEEIEAVAEALVYRWIGLGSKTKEFKEKFAKFIGTKYYITTFIPFLIGFIIFRSLKVIYERKLDFVFAMVKGLLWHFKYPTIK